MILSDYHLHTHHSSDSDASMESMILKAEKLGLKYICFTDHHDIGYPENHEGLTFQLNLPNYKNELFDLKEKYKSRIQIGYGIEIGITSCNYEACTAVTADENFDFVIGSTHVVDGLDPYDKEYQKKFPGKQTLEKYFQVTLENIHHFHDFCVYGHLDYPARYMNTKKEPFQYSLYSDVLDPLLKELITTEKGIEINTAGLKNSASPNPHMDILKRYRQLGGEIITVGSDGHTPEYLGYQFDKVPELLSSAGFQYYTIFEKRKPVFIKL